MTKKVVDSMSLCLFSDLPDALAVLGKVGTSWEVGLFWACQCQALSLPTTLERRNAGQDGAGLLNSRGSPFSVIGPDQG